VNNTSRQGSAFDATPHQSGFIHSEYIAWSTAGSITQRNADRLRG
jgi:hypothetical protein